MNIQNTKIPIIISSVTVKLLKVFLCCLIPSLLYAQFQFVHNGAPRMEITKPGYITGTQVNGAAIGTPSSQALTVKKNGVTVAWLEKEQVLNVKGAIERQTQTFPGTGLIVENSSGTEMGSMSNIGANLGYLGDKAAEGFSKTQPFWDCLMVLPQSKPFGMGGRELVFATDAYLLSKIPAMEKVSQGLQKLDAAKRGTVVIGETMARVESAASKIPISKILNAMPDFKAMGQTADQVTSSMIQYNRKWYLEQYGVVDLFSILAQM